MTSKGDEDNHSDGTYRSPAPRERVKRETRGIDKPEESELLTGSGVPTYYMTIKQSDSVAIEVDSWELANKDDYIEAVSDVLQFPVRKDDGLVKLFVVGSILNLFIAPAVSDALVVLAAIPGLILAGYLGYVGQRVGMGDEEPPDFEIGELKRYFFTGGRFLGLVAIVLFAMTLLIIPAAIIALILSTIGLGEIVETVMIYGLSTVAFVCILYFFPGWLIYGREHKTREMVTRETLKEEFFTRTIRREYIEAFVIYLPLGLALNVIHQISDFIPILTFLAVPLVFYIQLAMMRAIGRGYSAPLE